MSTRNTVTTGIFVVLMLALGTIAQAAVQYDAVLEWTGPYFRIANDPFLNQETDSPVGDIPFQMPTAVAAREHGTDGRDVVYVVDSGNNRIQVFEANATYNYTDEGGDTFVGGGATAASEWDDDVILLAEWSATADTWVLPGSEIVIIDGETWTYVSSLSGKTAADKVYTIDYADASDAPEIQFPSSSLSTTSEYDLRYLVTNNQTGATDAFGMGDVDYGIGNGAAPVLTEITEASGGPTSFEQLRAVAVIQNEQTATSDDLFILDTSDATEKLFYFTVPVAGTSPSFGETYDDGLNSPWDVAVARSGVSVRATVTPVDDSGPFDDATAVVVDDSQVTGHTYTITVAGSDVTITDATTSRVLLDTGPFADMDDPYLGVPGLSLPLNALIGATNTIATTTATIGRYVFVADTGNDRIKVIGLPDVASIAGDWLAGDARTVDAQPAAATTIGDDATIDYSESTPGTVTEDMTFWTATSPVKEGTLDQITFDPDGTPVVWVRIADLATASPSDNVYQVDWMNGMILFGDGIHGSLPPASTDFEYTYTTTPDILRWGSSGTGAGRFSGPKGIAARWNATIAAFDVYVSDGGNNRIQKLRFLPGNAAINIPARMEFVTEWNTASSASDKLAGPTDVVVQADGAGDIWVAVADAGNNRVAMFKDTAAAGNNGATAPVYDAALGTSGNILGQYAEVTGMAALANGNDLDWFVADGQRGSITKYEESPTPTIAVTWTGLPDCFPPTGSYTLAWTAANAPDGGYIDLYFDTASTFDAATAQLAYTSQSVTTVATSTVWTFANTPGGTPADGTYYLYARMHNSTGNLVASDQTLSTELLCIDSALLPTLSLCDRWDRDQTLYLQNGLERVINLEVLYPDSVISVGYVGSYDISLMEIVNIIPGTAWDAIGASSVQFHYDVDETNGTFLVVSSALDAPSGLTGNGPHVIAQMTVRARTDAINDTIRFRSSPISIDDPGTTMSDINGVEEALPTITDLTAKIAYLGDVASATGAGGTVPAMTPNPDGNIDFQDQMVFALGWNGRGNVRDPISDIGPISGAALTAISSPDGLWDVEDILAFTTMFSWAATQGYTGLNQGFAPGNQEVGSSSLSAPIADVRPALQGEAVAGKAYVYTVSDVEAALPGSHIGIDVMAANLEDMNGALLNLGFNSSELKLVSVEAGELFTDASGQLFLDRNGEGWLEISANRLDSATPGVTGEGTLAHLTFEILSEPTEAIDVQYDLRSSDNEILSRGAAAAGPLADQTVGFQLYSNYPNPLRVETNIVFSIGQTADVSIDIFDPSGRRVRALLSEQREAGYHVVPFDGRTDDQAVLPAGVYFFRLEADGQNQTRKLIITR